tara:strand:- start:1112 stop:1708 length:597 start_codon:yes stop_codon:yes gene_type:complete
LYIDVQRYFKTKQAKAPSASSYVLKAAANGEASAQSSHTLEDTEMTDAPELSAVKTTRTYHVNSTTGVDGTMNVERGELAKGYYYGSSAVPFGEDEADVTRFDSPQGFSIIGFVPKDKVVLNYHISTVILTQYSTRGILTWARVVSPLLRQSTIRHEWLCLLLCMHCTSWIHMLWLELSPRRARPLSSCFWLHRLNPN